MPQKITERVLRVGIIQNGRLLDKQEFRQPETVYMGDSTKSHFVIPSSSLSGKFPVFAYKGNHYELTMTREMTGKVYNGDGRELDVSDALKNGTFKKSGGYFVYPISKEMKGKISIGDVTIVFQFVMPSPQPPKLRLPKSIKGSWTERFDWVFISIMVGMMIIGYFFFGVYIANVPDPEPTELMEVPNRFAKLIAPDIEEVKAEEELNLKEKEDTPKEEPLENANAAASSKKQKQPEQQEAPAQAQKTREKPRDASTIQREESIRTAEMQRKVAGMGLLKMIGSVGEGGTGGVIADVLGDGGKDRDIDSALSGVKQIGVATSSSQRSRKGDAGAVETAKIDDLKVEKSSGSVAVKGRTEKAVVGKASVGAPEVDGEVDSASVAKTIKNSSKAVKRCYDKALLANPTLKGKVSVTIVIGTSGRVESVDITEDTIKDPEVAKCIKGIVSRLRFPKPDGGPASVTFPFVFTN